MCAIIGSTSYSQVKNFSWLESGLNLVKHRGPDNRDLWISENKKVVFGHRRLSIIDLSVNGNQPMHSKCKNYSIIFNGEIYNYKSISKNILEKGINLISKTDTEILLNSYKIWGINFLEKIEGMFSFAIYDRKKDIVICARDRAGEKPFYYYKDDTSFSFCSELKGLLENPKIERKIEKTNFNEFLKNGYVSGKNTLLENIFKLEAGEFLSYNLTNGNLIKKKYFSIPLTQSNVLNLKNENDLINDFNAALQKSVNQQIVADVPLGILLSGGIDSSIITALASNKNNQINTFTFITNKDDENNFEIKNSRLIAKHFATNHKEILYPNCTIKIFDEIMSFLDDPIMDSSIIPTFLISKEIKKYCTVALGGDGGDELFGGYDHYCRIIKLNKINTFLPNFLRKILSEYSGKILPVGVRGRNWLKLLEKNFNKDYLDFAIYFDEFTIPKIFNPKYKDYFKDFNFKEKKIIYEKDLIYKASKQDFCNFLIEDILVKTDRCSMANSLEMRSPFLDKNVIEFAFGKLHSKFKANTKEKKIFLKKFAKKLLPKDFISNKKKGFSIPLDLYFSQKEWYEKIKSILLDNDSLFNCDFIEKILKKPFFNHNNSERLFGLVLFELWRKKYRVLIH